MSLLHLLRTLNREAFEPLVALPAHGPLVDRMAWVGAETIILPQRPLKVRNPFPYLRTVFHLVNLIRRRRVDLIHSNSAIGIQYGLVAARLTGIPIICHIRFIMSERPFRRMFLRYADVLIAISRAVAESFADYVADAQKVVVIHNGVDLDQFSPNRTPSGVFRRRLGLSEDAFVVGHIGRICAYKGQDTLIEAMVQVVQRCPNVYALIVGDTDIDDSADFLTTLKKRVQQLGLARNVAFVEFVDDITSLYDDIDLVALPSVCEPFGRTLIEGMAMAKPVVATRAGGAVEIVDEGVTGSLVPPNDPASLSEAIMQIARDRELARRLGEGGRIRAQALFSIQRHTEAVEDVYRETLCRKGRGVGENRARSGKLEV